MDPRPDSKNEKHGINRNDLDIENNAKIKIVGEVECISKNDAKDVTSWSPPASKPIPFSPSSFQEKIVFLASNITVEPAIFLFIFSFSMCMVTTQSLVIRKYCLLQLNLSDAYCKNLTHDKEKEREAQELASTLNMYKILLETIPIMILALFLGSWSDKHGRKFLLLLPNTGLCCQLLLLVVYAVYETELEPRYLLLTAVPLALSGGLMSMMIGSSAYISDTSTLESRVLRLAVMQAFFLAGVPLGNIAGGTIFTKFGYIAVYVVAVVLSFICILYVSLVIKETVKRPEGLNRPCKDFFDLALIRQGLDTCFRKRENNHRVHLLLLILAMTFNFFPIMGEMSIAYLYTRKKFAWTEVMYSYYSSSSLLASMFGLLIILPILKLLVHLPDVAIALIGAAARVCSESLIAFAPDGWMLFTVCPFMVFTGMYNPILRGMMSHIVSGEEQGKLYSVLGACEAAMPSLGTVLYTKVYNATTVSFPGTVFLMSGSFFIIPTMIFVWLRRDINRKTNADTTKTIANDEITV